jgi:thioredoxin 1
MTDLVTGVVAGDAKRVPEPRQRRRNNVALNLTEQTFDEEIKSSTEPVLVDFWAEWCGPCKMVAPVLDQIVEDQAGKLKLAKINIDDNIKLAERFQVLSIPTLILFKDGEPQLRIVGAKPKGQLLQELQPYL